MIRRLGHFLDLSLLMGGAMSRMLLVLGILVVTQGARAAAVFVNRVQGVAVQSADVDAVEELVRNNVREQLGHELVQSPSSADYVLQGKLVKIGEAYSLTLIKMKDAREVFRASLKSSMMSDMDVVVIRLVRAVDAEVSADADGGVKDVTYHEQHDRRRRKEVLSQLTFALGPSTTSNLGVEGSSILWNVGYNYELDFNWDMHLDADWLTTNRSSEDDAYFAALNFGVNFYFSERSHSPYVEGHVGYGGAMVSHGCEPSLTGCFSKDRASGWVIGAGFGYRFFRTSESNFAIVLRGAYQTAETSQTYEHPAVGSLMIMGFFH